MGPDQASPLTSRKRPLVAAVDDGGLELDRELGRLAALGLIDLAGFAGNDIDTRYGLTPAGDAHADGGPRELVVRLDPVTLTELAALLEVRNASVQVPPASLQDVAEAALVRGVLGRLATLDLPRADAAPPAAGGGR